MITKMKILTGQGVLVIKNFKRLPMSTIILCIVVLVFLLTGCGSEPVNPYSYRPPEDIDDGLDIGTLEEVNIDSTLLEKAVDAINTGQYNEVHS